MLSGASRASLGRTSTRRRQIGRKQKLNMAARPKLISAYPGESSLAGPRKFRRRRQETSTNGGVITAGQDVTGTIPYHPK
ncbi:hypothetical protein RRG08_014241 [Elysia crispata]|uniref:Uncharacterized protein n=1 Tax=Elysia crispata TaxID=231223 RepID=A0AAE1CF14_9GAST|nr:hypothetical protein RRG08_014241 [Elysia crispata]